MYVKTTDGRGNKQTKNKIGLEPKSRLGPTGPPPAPPGWKVGRNQTVISVGDLPLAIMIEKETTLKQIFTSVPWHRISCFNTGFPSAVADHVEEPEAKGFVVTHHW